MKNTLILVAFFLLSASAFGDAATMQAECERQMALGICAAQTDAKDYAPGSRVLIGRRRVAIETYLYVRNGDKAMCSMVQRSCLADAGGDVCFVGKALWGQ